MSNSLKFHKKISNDTCNFSEWGITISKCSTYTVFDNETLLGYLYTNGAQSYADLYRHKLIINRERKWFKRDRHYVFDAVSKKEIALVTYGLRFNRTSAEISIVNQNPYSWYRKDFEVHKLFRPQTWHQFRNIMSNDVHQINFEGAFDSQGLSFKRMVNRPLTGTIQFNSPDPLAIICGLYCLECELDGKDRESA
ncbi:MAG TPA: hypothetical protein VMZ69_04430 [Saprospiraceae bacterium]|nr:hypothetical protein [Saprospiraceae bacterium]